MQTRALAREAALLVQRGLRCWLGAQTHRLCVCMLGQTLDAASGVLRGARAAPQVRPLLARLQATLLAAGGALVLGSGLLLSLVLAGADADGVYGAPCAIHNNSYFSQQHGALEEFNISSVRGPARPQHRTPRPMFWLGGASRILPGICTTVAVATA